MSLVVCGDVPDDGEEEVDGRYHDAGFLFIAVLLLLDAGVVVMWW